MCAYGRIWCINHRTALLLLLLLPLLLLVRTYFFSPTSITFGRFCIDNMRIRKLQAHADRFYQFQHWLYFFVALLFYYYFCYIFLSNSAFWPFSKIAHIIFVSLCELHVCDGGVCVCVCFLHGSLLPHCQQNTKKLRMTDRFAIVVYFHIDCRCIH